MTYFKEPSIIRYYTKAGFLTSQNRLKLLRNHRLERDGRFKDQIKIILLRDSGLSYESIAGVLFLSEESVRQELKDYVESTRKKFAPENGSSAS